MTNSFIPTQRPLQETLLRRSMKVFSKFNNNSPILFGLLFLLITISSSAQYTYKSYNLVWNPSLDSFTTCNPSNINDISPNLPPWKCTNVDTTDGPGIVDTCFNLTCCKPPNILWGLDYQFPHSGSGYIVQYFYNSISYIQQKLKRVLKQNHNYYIEFFVACSNTVKYFQNDIALLLSTQALKQQQPNGRIIANPKILQYSNPVIADTQNWVRICGIVKADSAYEYITIGNFKAVGKTVLIPSKISNPNYQTAYNIDDVSVIPLDSIQLQADAGKDTTIVQGDSAFIGTLINGLDTVRWQQNGTTVIDTLRPGFWVHPTVNTCYVLTQTVNGFTSSDTVCVFVRGLPVSFISQNLKVKTNNWVEYSWVTANEVNVLHYEVEKSIDGKAFYSIGKVAANNQQQNRYSFNDEKLVSGMNYYRVVAIDNDGRKTFSEIKPFTIAENKSNEVNIFPNPSNGLTNIFVRHNNKLGKTITIANLMGMVVSSYQLPVQQQVLTIDTKKLSSGMYIVTIFDKASATAPLTQKLIVK